MEISLYTIILIVLGFMAGAIPVFIIFSTLKRMRKKRESQAEKTERHQKSDKDIYHNLKSVKEERVENKEGISKTKN